MRTDQATAALADIGRKGGKIDERRYFRIDAGLGDGHATPTVPHQDNRTFDCVDHALRHREIIINRGQWELDCKAKSIC